MGYPSMYLDVPDEHGFVFTQGFQSIGLGLATAIGAAIARPDRLTVAALGDGGALMGVSELETPSASASTCSSWCMTTRRTARRSITSGRTGTR